MNCWIESRTQPEVLESLRARVGEIIGESYALAEGQTPARPPELDQETRQQLEALGYLEGRFLTERWIDLPPGLQ